MNKQDLKNILSILNRNAFSSFTYELLCFNAENKLKTKHKGKTIKKLTNLGEGICEENYWYGKGIPEIQGFILIYNICIPIELFLTPATVEINEPSIIKTLRKYKKIYKEREANWQFWTDGNFMMPKIAFITNFAGIKKSDYTNKIFPKLENLVVRAGYEKPDVNVGSCDSFIELGYKDVKIAFNKFINKYKDGLSISLIDEKISVNYFSSTKYLISGVLPLSKNPCDTLLVNQNKKNDILKEFEYLLNEDSSEKKLEAFLKSYYREIFGYSYDRIETQLWLRFPELDISNKNRRLDIFLRNCIKKDWDLFEIKRIKKLTRSYQDVPVLKSEILGSIQQLRNYNQILLHDKVKRILAKDGIEYYYPSLHLVVGKTPEIPIKQWRWLKHTNEKDIKLITYDELLMEMKLRLELLHKT